MSDTNGTANGTGGGYHWNVERTPPLSPRECYVLIDPDDAGRRRNLDCRYYEKCLDIAVKAKWGGFTCLGCPAYDPKTRMELIKEARGLFAIFDRQK